MTTISTPPCKFDPCDEPKAVKGLCRAHYMQQRRGKPLTPVKRWPDDKRRDPWTKCAYQTCTEVVAVGALCTAHKNVALKFSMSQEEYLAFTQDKGCEVCGVQDGRLYIDHDHSCCPSGKGCKKCIRGLLCMNCNTVLGRVKDSADHLRRLADYLEGNE